jgi:signal transduction histidine kinase
MQLNNPMPTQYLNPFSIWMTIIWTFFCVVTLKGKPIEHLLKIQQKFHNQVITDKCALVYTPNNQSIHQLHSNTSYWKEHFQTYINLHQKGNYYLRFYLENIDTISLKMHVQLSSIDVHRAKLYWIASKSDHIDSTTFNGSIIPLNQRPSKSSSLHFSPLFLPKTTYTCYLLMESSSIPVQSTLSLINPLSEEIHKKYTRLKITQGISFGIGFLYAIFAILIMFLRPERLYFGYALYTFSGAGYILASYGIGMELLWGEYPYFEEISAEFFGATMFMGLCIMSRFALNTKQRYPRLNTMIKCYEYSGILFLLIYGLRSWIPASVISLWTLVACVLLISSFILIAGLSFWDYYCYRGQSGFSFIMIFAVTIFTASLMIMAIIGLIPRVHFFEYLPQIAILAEVSLATIYIIKRVKQQILEQQHSIYISHIERQQDLVRISRDLHDELGSTLSTVSILLSESLKNLPSSTERKRITMVGEMVYEVMDQMSDIVWSMKHSNLQLGDVIARMREYACRTLETKKIDVHFKVEPNIDKSLMNIESRKNLYLIFKESINNAAKYSNAKSIWIDLSTAGAQLILSIRDNGDGFDLERCKTGNGLSNLRSRALELGASLQIDSQVGYGASILLHLPLAA